MTKKRMKKLLFERLKNRGFLPDFCFSFHKREKHSVFDYAHPSAFYAVRCEGYQYFYGAKHPFNHFILFYFDINGIEIENSGWKKFGEALN